jgi:conjugal transfer pilus assembly protein TraI
MTLRPWFRSRSPAGETSPPVADGEDLPRYPPFLRGLPTAPAARIVATQPELVAGLQDGLAFTDRRFAELVLPAVERYAAFVHLLPASEAHHHRGAGGLFRHGLEVARLAAQASQGRVFALDRSPGERRELEPRWRLAAALAGLCHDLGKPVSDLAITDRDGGTHWRPLLESLTDWAQRQGVDRYFLRWREQRHGRHEAFGLLVLERVLTPAVTAWLTDADADVMAALLATVAGLDDAPLGSLVRDADAASVERDLRENRLDPEIVSLGMPLDRYLVDAMRRLVRSGRWQINVPGARLWLFPDGLHVVWPAGADDVVGVLAVDRVPGIPRDPDTLADVLLERGVAVPRSEAGQPRRYWRLAPALLASAGQTIELSLLRLASPDLLLSGALPPPTAIALPEASVSVSAPAIATSERATPTPAQHANGGPAASAHERPPAPRSTRDANAAAPTPTPTPEAGAVATVHDAPDAAIDWLRAQGAGGGVLLALVDRVRADGAAGGRLHRLVNGQVLIRHPEGFADLGIDEPLAALLAAGLLETDRLTPMCNVRELEGQRGAVLSAAASRALDRLLGAVLTRTVPITPPAAVAKMATPASGPEPVGRAAIPPEPAADAMVVARSLVREVRERFPNAVRPVSEERGWLEISAESVRDLAAARGVSHPALLRSLSNLADCRVQANEAVRIRAAGDRPRAGA